MQEHAELVVDLEGPIAMEVVAVRGEEELSRLFRYEVECPVGGGSPRAGALLGREARLVLRDAFGGSRSVHGVVAEAERSTHDDGSVRQRVVVRPRAFLLSLGSASRAFQDVTVIDVVRDVLARASITARFEIVEPHAKREYRAQYREDDASFVQRILEEEGVYFWFDHRDDESVLVVADRSSIAADLEGGAFLAVHADVGMRETREVVEEIGAVARASFTRASVSSFDPDRPGLDLDASTGAGPFEVYEARGAGPTTPAEVARRARVLCEAAGVERALLEGTTSTARLVPGRVMEIGGDADARHDGRFLVVRSAIEIVQRTRDGAARADRAFVCRFRALPIATPFRPAEITPKAHQPGIQTGVVVGPEGTEVHPDASGRVRVQMHWDREGKRDAAAGRFVRVAQRGTADSMLLPRVGWNVLTFNEEGSPDVPSALGRLHDAEHPPAYALPANKTRVVFKTATTPGGGSFNEVRYEDTKGAEEMFLHASRDMGVLVKNDKDEVIDHDSQRAVAVDHALSVGKDHVESVGNDQSVTIGASERLHVSKDRDVSVGNDLTQSVGASRDLHVGATHAVDVNVARALKVGTAMIDVTLGPISIMSGTKTSTLVGGAMIRATAKTLSEAAKLGTVQTIGGAKIEIARRNLSIAAKLLHAETVGGAMVLKSADKIGESALATSMTVGGPMKIAAPKITVEGKKKVTLVCGASSITITDGSITVQSTKVKVDGSVLDADAPVIKHG